MPNQGDFFMVLSGLVHAVGRYGCGAAVLVGGDNHGALALDVCLMKTHLPQFYRLDELIPIRQVKLEDHGFCRRCGGWGITSMFEQASVDQILEGRHGEVCPNCEGSGRTGVKITIDRSVPGETKGSIDVDPSLKPLRCEICRAGTAMEL